jgi:hypothetical protein
MNLVLPKKVQRRMKREIKPASLSVNSEPWSNVVLDGKAFGTTPILNREIAPGKHRVMLTNPVRNLTRTVSFSVKPGESKRIKEILE